MPPYIVWRPLYVSGVDFYSWLRASTRLQRRLSLAFAYADERLLAVGRSVVRLALFRC